MFWYILFGYSVGGILFSERHGVSCSLNYGIKISFIEKNGLKIDSTSQYSSEVVVY